MDDKLPEESQGQINQNFVAFVMVGVLLLLGAIVWLVLDFLEDKSDEVQVIEELDVSGFSEQMFLEEYTYEGLLYSLHSYGAKEVSSGVQSYFYDTAPLEIDPDYNDAQNGFGVNEDINYLIYKLPDGYFVGNYNPESEEVYHHVFWTEEDAVYQIEIFDLKSEKSILTKEALETNETTKVEAIKERIEEINNRLTVLYEEMEGYHY